MKTESDQAGERALATSNDEEQLSLLVPHKDLHTINNKSLCRQAGERPLATSNDEELLLLQPHQVGRSLAHDTSRRWPQWVRTVGHVALGQVLSVLVCTTGVFSKRLAEVGIVAPTAQSFATYAMLGLFWSAVLYIRAPRAEPQLAATATVCARVREHGLKPLAYPFILAAADVEANYIVVKAYSLTTFTSVQLMGCASLPLAMVLSKRYLGRQYSTPHYLALMGCVSGLVLLVVSDTNADRSATASSPLIGDLLCLASGSLYAISNVGQEAVLTPADEARGRLAAIQAKGTALANATMLTSPCWLAQLGIFGSCVCALQILLLERDELTGLSEALRSGRQDVGWVATQALGFGLALFLFYSLAPILFAARGAVFFNLSLLTANFWAVLVGRLMFGERPMATAVGQDTSSESLSITYPAGFVLIMVAVTVFNVTPGTEQPENRQRRQRQAQHMRLTENEDVSTTGHDGMNGFEGQPLKLKPSQELDAE